MISQLDKIPRPFIVFLALAFGVAGLFYFQPPPSICDPLVTQFRRTFQGELFPRRVKDQIIPATFKKTLDDCRYGNSSGACFKYFDLLKRVAAFVHRSPSECAPEMAQDLSSLKSMFENGMNLMAHFAWGAGPGVNPVEKVGWFKEYEVSVFCEIKRSYQILYGDEAWFQFRWAVISKLPSVENGKPISFANEDQKFDRTLFSVNCQYL